MTIEPVGNALCKRSVLVVDDNTTNLRMMAEGLERCGHMVLVAQDGEEALDRVAMVHPDLILLDVMMPGIDGFEVCRRLRAQPETSTIPVIFMTALAEMKDKLTAFEAGAVDYVTKPIQIEEVIARVTTQLELGAMRRRLEAQNTELALHRDNLERLVSERTDELEQANRQLRNEIEERRRTQDELAAREREFRTLAENSPDNIARHDPDCRFLYLNPQFELTLGRKGVEIIGKIPSERFPGNQRMIDYEAAVKSVIETGDPAEFEVVLLDRGEGERYLHIRLVAEHNEQGSIVGVLAIGRNITRLREAEQALYNREREFRTLAENLPDTLLRYNLKACVVYANPLAASTVPSRPEDVIGMTALKILPDPGQAQCYDRALKRVMTTGEPEKIELYLPDGANNERIYQVSFVAECRSNGQVRGALAIGRDITLLKQIERRLAESHAQMQALARRQESAREEERKHIARELHDELGQYLTALGLHASVLKIEFGEENSSLGTKLESIFSLVEHTKKVVRNLSQQLRPPVLDMGVGSALEMLVDLFVSQYEIPCSLELDPGMKAMSDTFKIVVYRVVQESLTNIARYAEAKTVDIILKYEDDNILLEVNDDGKGFEPSEIKPNAFGLVGMRERLLAVGGEFEVVSELKHGTQIIARMPLS